jgi:hypothetical protein
MNFVASIIMAFPLRRVEKSIELDRYYVLESQCSSGLKVRTIRINVDAVIMKVVMVIMREVNMMIMNRVESTRKWRK